MHYSVESIAAPDPHPKVKIVFLCTSLAPGRDGVGDYVRQLAAACGAAGHACLLVALNDRHLIGHELVQRGNEVRFAGVLSWSRRATLLGNLLRDFDPHWISWQVVPYGFHPKGILPEGCLALAEVAKPWSNHVMLHELWLGLAREDRLHPRVIGALQRGKLLNFLRRLRPACLQTTNDAYQLALARRGWLADLLPLFGNIPVAPIDATEAQAALKRIAGDLLPTEPHLIGVIFGTIHPQWQTGPTLEWLEVAGAHLRRKICLLAVGRPGANGAKLLTQLAQQNDGPLIINLGAQEPETISPLLQAADFGIATHPWELIEKSGTTVALLEHGLPVVVPRDDWQPRDGTLSGERDPLLRRLQDLPLEKLVDWLRLRRPPEARLTQITANFLAQLTHPGIQGALVA